MRSSGRAHESAGLLAPPLVTFQAAKVRHIVGCLSHDCLGDRDLVLANRARDLGSELAQPVPEIGSAIHRDAPIQRSEEWHTLMASRRAAVEPAARSGPSRKRRAISTASSC